MQVSFMLDNGTNHIAIPDADGWVVFPPRTAPIGFSPADHVRDYRKEGESEWTPVPMWDKNWFRGCQYRIRPSCGRTWSDLGPTTQAAEPQPTETNEAFALRMFRTIVQQTHGCGEWRNTVECAATVQVCRSDRERLDALIAGKQ